MPNPYIVRTPYNHFDADPVDERLHVGGIEAVKSVDLNRFSMVVLCARTLQPKLSFSGEILRPAFDDANPIPADQAARAIKSGHVVAKHIEDGGLALVTCAAGLNRSALVAAFAMKQLHPTWTAQKIIDRIRNRRSSDALCNSYFCQLIEMYCR